MHWKEEQYSASTLNEAAANGTTLVCDDFAKLVNDSAIEIIIEATGNPVVAADHILAAFARGKHVVSATVELDSFCGVALAQSAKSAGVVYSMAFGDQKSFRRFPDC